MFTPDQSQGVALFARLFSSLYINPPTLELLQELTQQNFADQWPFDQDQQSRATLNHWHATLAQEDNLSALQKKLTQEHLHLFIGVGMPQVPLWGSVYLDAENLLMGPSCQALEKFLAQADLMCTLKVREPLDHLGLILAALAVFLERIRKDGHQNQDVLLTIKNFLELHINPWVYRCLALQEQQASSFFYQAVGQLTHSLVLNLSQVFNAQKIKTQLYY